MATSQLTKGNITLRGSTQIVVEFFDYSINSILFQRGLYPPEDFKMVKKYGLNMLVTTDDALQTYLKQVMSQLNEWMLDGKISKLVLVINSKETMEVLERWQFDIQIVSPENGGQTENKSGAAPQKTEKEIHAEIQAIIRQITASVTFLPVLEEKCSFNILVYADKDVEVPTTWIDSDPHYIKKNSEQVKLRSFSTNIHKIDALVAYRLDDEV
ncbi:HORMA domain-containing protein [Basidiobolus meristosporus CBS 931.73]|uniref:HORMA domain-containing protein n=1 Tax=Basidiobolus meristosporus CBS 931.73 TaxID=1314790 RepID=A0A1Y1Y0K4_9FUNG|nr:HORMA domain-containing protein [Basidiobolus meristosporus CBS 931.73]|eukprot:ORX91542.1 HORMA domain-containing protein [Basidiobolus meristosporus CBS 931.73]